MVLKANDRRTSCPCHDEFRGPRSDYVRQHSLQCQESHEASHCDVNRCYGNRPRWMTGRVPGGRDLSRTLTPADWLCRNVTGYALFECSTVILRTEVS
ncbi:hypothetical protein TNCV_1975041 [Trichonephila clavipes]|nr:hypothetical protein TNCV_1975041 [Trichonephila clavipes]